MFKHSQQYYESIYHFKDYKQETQLILEWISQYKQCDNISILDVACGIGGHIAYLKDHFNIEGLDINQEMLDIAQRKYPDIQFHCADMINFDLNRQYGTVICLFSSIGYVKTIENLKKTIYNMSKHLLTGGLLIVEAWFTPKDFIAGSVHANFIDQDNLKLARITKSEVKDTISIMDMQYLVGTKDGVEHFKELHEMGLFTHQQYLNAFQNANLTVHYDPKGLMNRGLYIGVKK